MRRITRNTFGLAVVSVISLLAVGSAQGPTTSPVMLDVPGRSDATPWVASSGSFAAVAWGATAAGKTDVFLAVSRDGGRTFSAPVQVNSVPGEARLGGELPPRVALVPRRGATPEIVVLWTAREDTTQLKTARSRDGGLTFTPGPTLPPAGTAGDRGWPSLAVGPGGATHAIWLDHRGLAADRAAGASHEGHQAGAKHDGAAMAQKSGLYYAQASGSRPVEREVAKGVCYCCKTTLAVGPTGQVYAAWRHVYPGNLRDMAFTVSRDGGKSFAAPVRISEDGWVISGCPDDGPAMSVDGQGTVHVVWPTVVGGDNPEGAIFYSSTQDARQFAPRVRVATLGGRRPAHPQVLAGPAGTVFVAWDEIVNGDRIAALREVRLRSDKPPTFGAIVRLSSDGHGSYPVLALTESGILAVWTSGTDSSRISTRVLPVRSQ